MGVISRFFNGNPNALSTPYGRGGSQPPYNPRVSVCVRVLCSQPRAGTRGPVAPSDGSAAIGIPGRHHFGLGVDVGVGVGMGIRSTCPTRIMLLAVNPLASNKSFTRMPNRFAIISGVSPGRTLYFKAGGMGVGVGVSVGVGVRVGDGVRVGVGVGVHVGVSVNVGVGVGMITREIGVISGNNCWAFV